jgi:hypothetical protein
MEDSVNDLILAGAISQETADGYLRDSTDDSNDLPTGAAGGGAHGKKGPPVAPAKGVKPGGPPAKAPPVVKDAPTGGGDGGGYSF